MKSLVIQLIFLIASINTQSQDISTRGEIYDFEVGDVFHKTRHLEADKYVEDRVINIHIIDKYEIQQPLHRVYVRDISVKSSENGNPYVYDFYIDTIYIGNLDGLINNGEIDSVYTNPDLYNGRLINAVQYFSNPYSLQKERWANGCGMVYWHYDDEILNGVWFDIELIYFKKGEEEWGTPNIVGVKETSGVCNNILNYPNPFTTSTTISYILDKPENVHFTIYTVQGKIVYTIQEKQEKGEQKVLWNAEGLPAGMYYFMISDNSGRVGGGKLLKN